MAGAAGGDEATVSKEMAGNSFAVSSGRCHRASTAQRGRESRRVSCVRPGILDGERGAGLVRRLVVREHWSPGRIAGGIAVERPGLMVFASAIHRAINERRLDPPGLTRARRGIRARLRHKGKRRHGRGGPEERRGEIPGARPIGQCVCSIESGPCERVDVFHVSGRFWSTSACGEKRTPARPAWTSFPS